MARLSVEHVPAALEGFEIKVTVNTSPNGGYSITGIGLNRKGQPVAKAKRVRQAKNKSMIPAKKLVVQNLVNTALAANVKKTQRRNSVDGLDEDNRFVKGILPRKSIRRSIPKYH